MLKHPLLPVTICYAAGVAAAAFVPVPLIPGFLGAFAGTAVALACPRARPWLLALLLGLAGGLNLTVRTRALAPHDLRRVSGAEPALATVRGHLETTPTLRVYGTAPNESFRTLATVSVSALRTTGEWRATTGRCAVSTPGTLEPALFGGRDVEVYGVLRAPRGPRAPGLFDPRPHFGWQGIHRQLETQGTNDWRLAPGPQPPRPALADRFLTWAQATLARGLPVEDEPLRLLWAMTLGWRTALTDEVSAPFMRTGTMHIFAISGLHIALIAGMLVALLRVLQVPRGATGLGVVPLIWFYTVATGWQPSAIRATLMMTVVITGWALRRPGNLLNSLAGSAFLILLWDPRQLFQASFQLSFFVVLSMALLGPPLVRLRDRVLQTDPLLPVELLPRWRRMVEPSLRYLTLSFAISVAAWLGSLPLIAHYFHLVTPGGLLVNVVIVPLSSLALMSNLGALVCGDWLPALTVLFNHSAWFWMVLLTRVSEWGAGLPGACFYVPAPGVAAVLAYYAALVAVASGWAFDPRRRWPCAGALVLLAVGFGWRGWHNRQGTDLAVLPLRGGAVLWVDDAGRVNDLLVDCGNEFAAGHTVVPFLHGQGVNRLSHLVLTHGDIRHVGGAGLVETNFRPAAIWVGPGPFRSPSYRAFLRQPRAAAAPRTAARGDTLAGWAVLHPDAADAFPRADDAVLVLARDFGRVRVLVVSDLGPAGQAALGSRGAGPRAEIVITGLPTAGEPLEAEWLTQLQPRLIVVCDDEQPTSARAGPALRRRLLAGAERVLFTAETGVLTLRVRDEAWEVRDVDGRVVATGRELK